MKTVQTLTVTGSLTGPNFTVPAGFLQQAGIFTATNDFEVLGYQSIFSMQMDFSALPPVFPVGVLVYNINGPRITLPAATNPASNQNSFFLSILQALNTSQPAAAYAGAPAQIFGTNAVSFSFPPGQPLRIFNGQSLTTYLQLAGVSAFNSAIMTTILYVNL